MKKIIVAIVMFLGFLIPVPAHADTCVDDLINLGTGICIDGGPKLPSLLPLDPPLIRRPLPTVPVPVPQVTPTPNVPRQTPQQPVRSLPKKTAAPKPQPKSSVTTRAPRADEAQPKISLPTTTAPTNLAPVEKEQSTVFPKDKNRKCIIVHQERNVIEVGYTAATVAGIVAIAVCASFLIFYRRRP